MGTKREGYKEVPELKSLGGREKKWPWPGRVGSARKARGEERTGSPIFNLHKKTNQKKKKAHTNRP